MVQDDDVVLDVGGWAKPFSRADWVLDLLPHATRGLYGERDPDRERFTSETWIQRDICAREPFPFADDEIDFAVCSHTLEDVRDPVWVCSELSRVAKAGYIEVPSRLQEQCRGVHGPWVGWSHHHWLVDIEAPAQRLEFVFKSAILHAAGDKYSFPPEFAETIAEAAAVECLFWRGSIAAGERVFIGPDELPAYLGDFVREHLSTWKPPPRSLRSKLRARLAAARAAA